MSLRKPRLLQIGLDAFGPWLFVAAAVFGLVSCVATVVGTAAGVRAQDGHAQMHHEYLKWKDGRGYGCCNELDCRPTRAFMGDDGRWRALVDGLPIVVPPDAVLNIPSPDGRSHICMSPGAIEPRCFVPAEPRS